MSSSYQGHHRDGSMVSWMTTSSYMLLSDMGGKTKDQGAKTAK